MSEKGDEIALPVPVPNYGRGAAFGIGSVLIAAVFWVILIVTSGEYNFMIMVGIGWFVSASVKRGMGITERVGMWIALYGTLLAIVLGQLGYLGFRVYQNGGRILLDRTFQAFGICFAGNLKFTLYFIVFAALGCLVVVLNYRKEISRTGRTRKRPRPKDGSNSPRDGSSVQGGV